MMLKETSRQLKAMGITSPTLLVDEAQARRNIQFMADKARQAGARFRPHFKTHQSAEVGQWFLEEGVQAITVSSLAMAEYFADHGWSDLTIAFLLNPLEKNRLLNLAARLHQQGGKLAVTVDSEFAARWLVDNCGPEVRVWLKIDTGYGRTGVPWQQGELIDSILTNLAAGRRCEGLLSHSGHSYGQSGQETLTGIWHTALQRLQQVQREIHHRFAWQPAISLGDTPCCRAVPDLTAPNLPGPDEIRPGNFVFFDLMQWQQGVCEAQEMAAAVVCPVVGLYPQRHSLVLHGGAVHLAREFLTRSNGQSQFGMLGTWHPQPRVLPDLAVTSLSQEHGTVKTSPEVYSSVLKDLEVGDLVLVWPVHSCLSCDLASEYVTTEGNILTKA